MNHLYGINEGVVVFKQSWARRTLPNLTFRYLVLIRDTQLTTGRQTRPFRTAPNTTHTHMQWLDQQIPVCKNGAVEQLEPKHCKGQCEPDLTSVHQITYH